MYRWRLVSSSPTQLGQLGFLFDFEPGFDRIFEQPFTGFGKMPDFVDVLDLVAQRDGFCKSVVHHVPVRICS